MLNSYLQVDENAQSISAIEEYYLYPHSELNFHLYLHIEVNAMSVSESSY